MSYNLNVEINMNDKVTVTLTKEGARIHNEHWTKFTNMEVKEGYVLQEQLWELFHVFGKHTFNGCKPPFQNNQVTILKVSG